MRMKLPKAEASAEASAQDGAGMQLSRANASAEAPAKCSARAILTKRPEILDDEDQEPNSGSSLNLYGVVICKF